MKQVAVLQRAIWQGTEGDLQPTTDWELRLLVLACKHLSPANNYMDLEVDLSPTKPSDENPAPADTLIATL